ncbi:MAG: hypothetical protein H7320_14225 [Ferruginibacter sp.]|nr:hypothetical protein [Ferruginibacter sp.]
MADNKLVEGIRYFAKRENAPEFVLGTLVISPRILVDFIKNNPDVLTEYNSEKQLKMQILRSKAGNPYLAVDNFVPTERGTAPAAKPAMATNDDLPF